MTEDNNSEQANTGARVSPSSLTAYVYCPRKYEFEKAQRIQTIDDTKRYLQQGLAMHETIERTCRDTATGDEAAVVHDRMVEHFPTAWAEEVEESAFASAAQLEYYRRMARAGLEAFFDPEGGAGIEHARQSVVVETRLTCERHGVPLEGYTDNVLRTDDGLHVIDYKRNLNGMLTSGTAERLEQHLNGEEHEPGRVKNAMQVATYTEGIKETEHFEPGMEVRFSFYGLLNHTDVESGPDGYSVSTRGYPREMTAIYEDYYETIWDLIQTAYKGIQTERFEPEPRTLIFEEGCGECEYRAMCPDYLGEEVKL